MEMNKGIMEKIFYVVAVLIAALCVFTDNYEDKKDKLEKIKIFLSYQIPQDTQMVKYSNGFRNFLLDVKYSSKTMNLDDYKEKIRSDGWRETNLKGWLRDGEKETDQTIYVRDNYIYIVTKQDDNSWRELVITNDNKIYY